MARQFAQALTPLELWPIAFVALLFKLHSNVRNQTALQQNKSRVINQSGPIVSSSMTSCSACTTVDDAGCVVLFEVCNVRSHSLV